MRQSKPYCAAHAGRQREPEAEVGDRPSFGPRETLMRFFTDQPLYSTRSLKDLDYANATAEKD
jgi:hypothetical protein